MGRPRTIRTSATTRARTTLTQLMDQDLEPDPTAAARGSARVSPRIAASQSRTRRCATGGRARASASTATSAHRGGPRTGLILSGAITPANRPEEEAAPQLAEDIANQCVEIGELFIDRGYVKAALVDKVLGRGGEIVCRPWVPRGKGVFTKAAFKINVRDLTITCPAGETERIVFGAITEFDPEACDRCALRSKCTAAAAGLGLLTRRACPGATGRGGPRAASSRPARPAARRAARTPARRRRRVRGAARPRHRFRTASRPD
jgi:hypothetical protein